MLVSILSPSSSAISLGIMSLLDAESTMIETTTSLIFSLTVRDGDDLLGSVQVPISRTDFQFESA